MSGIQGTTIFTGEYSQRGYRLNRMAMSLTEPANRERFRADEAGYMRAMKLTEPEIDMILRRDWPATIEAGGSIYLMIKIAGTVGQNLLQVGAKMRGQTVEQFMATRPRANER
ncbi:MAG TPA: protocatechuate 3,4-dioxygenase [Acetobacteraceae bacterium]